MADGSIIFSTKLDNEQLEKDLKKQTASIKKTEADIERMTRRRNAANERSVFSAAELDAEKAKLAQMKKDLLEMKAIAKDKTASPGMVAEAKAAIPGAQADIADQQERVRALQSEYNKLYDSVQRYDEKLQDASEELARQKEEAGGLAQQLAKAGPSTERMKKSMEKAQKSAHKFSLRLREVMRSALIFTLITQTLAKFRDWMGKVIKTNDEARAAVARLKGALLTLAQPLADVIIPAFADFVDFLARAVSYVAQLVAVLFGTTAENAADSAEKMYEEQEAIEGVGNAAKKATKQLAAFDEITQLAGDSADSASDVIAPDFSSTYFAKVPEWLTSFSVTLQDILFGWEDLTAQDVLEKLVTALTAICGAVVGFSVGGFGGAALGMTAGVALSATLCSFLFDGNAKLNVEEILSSLCVALEAAAGAIIGFSVGGIKGAAIGLTVGASAGVAISSMLFDGDGKMDTEELVSSLCVALGAIAGGVVGFTLGGVKGAAVGVIVGAGVTTLISNLLFDNDGVLSEEEIAKSVCAVLGAIVGGVIGFSVGGPGGAFIGATLGATATATLSGLFFNNDGRVSSKEILTLLCAVLGAIVGGVIGFTVGGPLGAAIGATIGATLTIRLTDVLFEGFSNLKDVPGFTGFGPDYSWMFKSSVEVPGLASGSVIPPNREFLAVLGDNKTEAEVVSPLSTMKQAMIEALRESGGGGEQVVVLELDGREFGRAVYKANRAEGQRLGVTLVGG